MTASMKYFLSPTRSLHRHKQDINSKRRKFILSSSCPNDLVPVLGEHLSVLEDHVDLLGLFVRDIGLEVERILDAVENSET